MSGMNQFAEATPKIDKLRKPLLVAHVMLPRMTLRALLVFLEVVREEGLSVSEYSRRMQEANTTVSRTLQDLSGLTRPGQSIDRVALVHRRENPANLRETCYTLTDRGRKLAALVFDALE